MMMGAVYLTYSAYYVSVNVNGIKSLISMIINILYIVLFVVVVKNSLKVLTVLRLHHAIIQTNDI